VQEKLFQIDKKLALQAVEEIYKKEIGQLEVCIFV
jgi:hypothetical protein